VRVFLLLKKGMDMSTSNAEQQDRYIRLKEIIGDRKTGQQGIVQISRSHLWDLVKAGKFPKPFKLSAKCTVWRLSEVMRFLESIGQYQQTTN
jgi:prophage regulatory protein